MNLDALRARIDELDARLIELLNERTRVVLDIGRLKDRDNQEVYVPAREQEVLARVLGQNRGPLAESSVRAIYREIMSAALALERGVRIAYFGQPATFTHQAAWQRFGASVQYVPCPTVTEVFAAVQNGAADYGVVPVENSTEGPVNPTLDELMDTPLKIYAEIYLPVSHHLMGRGPRERIERVYSHPQVFGQCRRWLLENLPRAEQVPAASTARAAEIAAGEADAAALASELAAELHGLPVLARDVQDLAGNTTRFHVMARSMGPVTGRDKTSVLFAVRHRVGALYDALVAFKDHGLNMTKIESRPSRARAWEYCFFVDLEGHAEEERMRRALEELAEHCLTLKVLGSYPMAQAAT